jgi:GDP-mannose 6-dehydrogenase
MKLSIFGLGYVGTITSACLARNVHEVVGVDINRHKVELLNDGKSPIVEEEIGDMVMESVRAGRLRATEDVRDAILNTDISLICVGTPSNGNGSLSLHSVISVCRSIAQVLRHKRDYHLIVLRSTVLPGTVSRVILPLIEQESGKKLGNGFGLCFNPEFLREGSSVKDFFAPPFTLIGSRDRGTGEKVQALYQDLDAPVYLTSIEVAESVKYASNAFHALKIAFANEMGAFCKALDIDSHQVMEIFAKDTKLNISNAYMRPGFAFGGSCLPKDLRAILYEAKMQDVQLPVCRRFYEQ